MTIAWISLEDFMKLPPSQRSGFGIDTTLDQAKERGLRQVEGAEEYPGEAADRGMDKWGYNK